jgi:hypothetical protein
MILDRTGTTMSIRTHSEDWENIERALLEVVIARRREANACLVPLKRKMMPSDTMIWAALHAEADRFLLTLQRIRELRNQ